MATARQPVSIDGIEFDEALTEYLESLTDEQRAGQLSFSLMMADLSLYSKENVKQCRAATRQLLERVRDGKATIEERTQVAQAVKLMSEEREPAKNSAFARQTYILTLRYLAPDYLEVREIAALVNIDTTTVHRDINAAIGRLAFWLFGIIALEWE